MRPTPEEIKAGQLSDAHLRLAMRTLRDAGMVEIEGVYERAWVDDLRAAYNEELERYIAARGGMEGINAKSFGQNHIGMHLPLVMPFSDPQIVANPIAVQVMTAALGDNLRCSFYHSNTAYPGSKYQPIHRDWAPVFGTELSVPTPVMHVVLNIPLVDFTEENGSTQVWPGTHLIVDTDPSDGKADQLEERVKYMAAARPNISAGSVVIRDLRMWHRGMPNDSNQIRTMLALVYQRGFTAVNKRLDIPRDTWESWPDQARQIFRDNNIVETAQDTAARVVS